ncbi:MAG: hypothetical protein B6245_21505 [Desulfobacteraceae bacterium 4572_88]|nr:MAG: hypothetical protein B6245_21505 [Desulfobacteraceae bacterium 4572_88]
MRSGKWEVGSIDNIRGFLSLNLGCFPALHFFQIDVHHPHGVVVPESGVGSIDNIRGFLSLNLGCFPRAAFFSD